ncbi:diguanylate cyclase [Deinococcus sp. KSM4-11]|uniref:GGDEF domain-containing protein n=1 Tax=Deinococcus sp. KSM4-11 TaxID=2568654 RepID=UPI001454CFFB|nr:GGDEF domain-containing protein [Deinococcus sp. KSM4-11]
MLNIQGAVMLGTGQPAAALAYLEQQLQVAQVVGDLEMEGLAHNDIGVLLVWDDAGRAAERYQMAYDVFRAAGSGHEANLGLSAFNLSVAYREQGDRLRSDALLAHAEELVRGAEAWPYWVGIVNQRALRLAEQGQTEAALALFLDAAHDHPDLPVESVRFLRFFQAKVLVLAGDPAAALAILDELHVWFLTRRDMLDDVLDVRAQAEAALGDMTRAYSTMRALLDTVRARYRQEQEVQLKALETVQRTAETQRAAQQLRDQAVALRALHNELQHLSLTDELTGLHNRRHFLQWSQQRLAERLPLALAFVDVDHFKAVNDQAGHEAGDRVMRVVADLLRVLIEPGTLVARLGGDEFVVARIADTPHDLAAHLQVIRQQCSGVAWSAWLPGIAVTLSIGVVMAHTDVATSLRLADEAMYLAKQGGRNQVVTVTSGVQ